jgi:hypothetical protein
MKLNPPASSSDLEAAREIARRLHQRRRSADRSDREHREADGPAARVPSPLPVAPEQAPTPRSLPTPLPTPPPVAPAPVADEASSAFEAAFAFETPAAEAPSVVAEPELDDPVPPAHEAVFELPASMGFGPTAVAEDAAPPSWDDAEAPAEITAGIAALEDLAAPAHDEASGITLEPPPPEPAQVSPEEMIGQPEADDDEDDTSLFDEAEAEDGTEEELFDSTPPPSWDEVVEACLELAAARAAMIVDPSGQVLAAGGSWPDPGPEAIAGRLVAMMERTLRDAPTRSISAPLGGQHLTAWRIPLAEGLVTAAFIGDAPLRAEIRPTIDAEIHRGPGA